MSIDRHLFCTSFKKKKFLFKRIKMLLYFFLSSIHLRDSLSIHIIFTKFKWPQLSHKLLRIRFSLKVMTSIFYNLFLPQEEFDFPPIFYWLPEFPVLPRGIIKYVSYFPKIFCQTVDDSENLE